MIEGTLSGAPVDDEAFRRLTDPHRRELQVHCYRLLGSVQDAEDMLQETLLAGWRSLERFEGRASLRAWLYRIATNRCLNALRAGGRRPRDLPPEPPFEPPRPTLWSEPMGIEPYPDALLDELADASPGPEARYEAREAIELGFIVALRHLPPRQRAALVLRDVLGFHTEEVAHILGARAVSVKGALQRARATLQSHLPSDLDRAPPPTSEPEHALARRFADAFENDDIEGVVALLTHDAWIAMPPYRHAYQGREAIGGFLRASAIWRSPRRYTLVARRANTQPAFGCYLRDVVVPISHPG
ncbi:MAG: RNA polymerase subunit sigma-70, partial [Chloroflexota bacterium]